MHSLIEGRRISTIKEKGLFGESFSDLINRLITETDKIKEE
jgi:hypothetical protein